MRSNMEQDPTRSCMFNLKPSRSLLGKFGILVVLVMLVGRVDAANPKLTLRVISVAATDPATKALHALVENPSAWIKTISGIELGPATTQFEISERDGNAIAFTSSGEFVPVAGPKLGTRLSTKLLNVDGSGNTFLIDFRFKGAHEGKESDSPLPQIVSVQLTSLVAKLRWNEWAFYRSVGSVDGKDTFVAMLLEKP